MSTLGGLLLPQFQPFDLGRSMNQGILGGSQMVQGQTDLLQLADLKRAQDAQAALYQSIAQNPDALLGGASGGMPQSTLGAAGPGAITQRPLPGMPGQAQTVPAYPDASRYAGVSPQSGGPIPPDVAAQMTPTVTTPQSTLGSLGAPSRPDPVRALMQQNPQAGMQLIDLQTKHQERMLGIQEKKFAFYGQLLQGATDQASWDQAREQIGRVDQQAAARMPPMFNTEVRDQMLEQALSRKDSLTQRLEARKLDVLLRGQDVDMLKLQQQGGKLNYQTDAQGHIVAVPEYATGTGGVQSRPVLGSDGQTIKSLEGQKLTADQQKHLTTQEGQLRTHVDTLLKPYYEVRDAIGRIEASATSPDSAGDLALITAYMKMLDPTTGVRDMEFRNAENIGGFVDRIKTRLANWASGDRLIDETRSELLDRARRLYQQYEQDYGQVKQQYRDLTTRLGGNPANVVLETGSTAAKPPTAVVTKSQLTEWATQRSKDLGRPVTVEEVTKDVKAKGFRVE